MSIFDEKIAAARAIIDEHNSSVEKDDQIDIEVFFKKLRTAGGTTDAALVECMWEDIQAFVTPPAAVPILVAKRIATVFRKRTEKPKALSEKRVLVMDLTELLQTYSSKEPNSLVGVRLNSLAAGRPFLVFNEDDSLNIDASLACLKELQEGLEPRMVYVGTDGVPQPIYTVGTKPEIIVAENPLLPGETLRGKNESCGKTFRSWAKIPQKIRVILRLALNTGELRIDHIGKIHDALDLFVGKSTESMEGTANQRFPQASLKYRELEKTGSLPTLKVSRITTSNKKHDPFFGSGHRTF